MVCITFSGSASKEGEDILQNSCLCLPSSLSNSRIFASALVAVHMEVIFRCSLVPVSGVENTTGDSGCLNFELPGFPIREGNVNLILKYPFSIFFYFLKKAFGHPLSVV